MVSVELTDKGFSTMFRIFGVAILLLTSPSLLFCEETGKPVPSEWLHNGRLVVPSFNFSVGTPNPESHWTYLQLPSIQGFETTGFIVELPSKERYVVVVWNASGNDRLDDAVGRKKYIEGVQKSLPKGWTIIGDPEIQAS